MERVLGLGMFQVEVSHYLNSEIFLVPVLSSFFDFVSFYHSAGSKRPIWCVFFLSSCLLPTRESHQAENLMKESGGSMVWEDESRDGCPLSQGVGKWDKGQGLHVIS